MSNCNLCRTGHDSNADYNNALSYVKCTGYPVRNISVADVIAYAQRSGVSGNPSSSGAGSYNDQLCSVMEMLIAGRIIYYKNTPGDCPLKSNISLGPASAISKAGSLGIAGIGAVSSVSLLATGGAGVGASAAGAGAALGGLPAIFGTVVPIVGLALIPIALWGAISAHHKIAVAREQATICDFAQAYNEWEEAIENGIQQGLCTVTDAKNAVPAMEQQMMQGLQSIAQNCNAACIMQKALRGLDLYAVEKLYDSLGASFGSTTSALPGASKSAPSAGTSGGTTGLLLAGAGVFAAKLAGAF